MDNRAQLENNINIVKKNIEKVCLETGRNPRDIIIVAAVKGVEPERLNMLKSYGINICGENTAQQLVEKYPHVGSEWHFIGRLQTNKVKYIIDKVKLIHSLDRDSLAKEIERQCQRNNIPRMDVLIEVNMGEEESKGGVAPEGAEKFYLSVKENYPRLNVLGLMSVMPIGAGEEYYLQIKNLYDKINVTGGGSFKYLSVGMTDDYMTAIKYGANMIRLGTALFGQRRYGG